MPSHVHTRRILFGDSSLTLLSRDSGEPRHIGALPRGSQLTAHRATLAASMSYSRRPGERSVTRTYSRVVRHRVGGGGIRIGAWYRGRSLHHSVSHALSRGEAQDGYSGEYRRGDRSSLGGGNVYVRNHIADIRLGLLLALATVPGAVVGALLATHVPSTILAGIFALVIAASSFRMFMSGRRPHPAENDLAARPGPGTVSRLQGEFFEPSSGEIIRYRVIRVPYGVAASSLAGLISVCLGWEGASCRFR